MKNLIEKVKDFLRSIKEEFKSAQTLGDYSAVVAKVLVVVIIVGLVLSVLSGFVGC